MILIDIVAFLRNLNKKNEVTKNAGTYIKQLKQFNSEINGIYSLKVIIWVQK